MSDSMRPHGLHPARPLCPWNSPGKNTRGGFHFLLQIRIVQIRDRSEVIGGAIPFSLCVLGSVQSCLHPHLVTLHHDSSQEKGGGSSVGGAGEGEPTATHLSALSLVLNRNKSCH